MVFQMIQSLLSWAWLKMTGLFWTLGTTTATRGKSNGTLQMPELRRHGKPPLHKKKKRRPRKVSAVLYLDEDYWDAQMVDVEDMDYG